MSMLTRMRKDKMIALKEKDSVKNGVLSLLISALALAEKEQGRELSNQEALVFVQRELKQTKDTLEQTPANRVDLLQQTQRKIEIIESYLPQQMSGEDLISAAKTILEETQMEPVMKNKGILIKELMLRYQGQTDGKSVSAAVSSILK